MVTSFLSPLHHTVSPVESGPAKYVLNLNSIQSTQYNVAKRIGNAHVPNVKVWTAITKILYPARPSRLTFKHTNSNVSKMCYFFLILHKSSCKLIKLIWKLIKTKENVPFHAQRTDLTTRLHNKPLSIKAIIHSGM